MKIFDISIKVLICLLGSLVLSNSFRLNSRSLFFNSNNNNIFKHSYITKCNNNDELYEPIQRPFDWDPKEAPKLDFNEDFYSILEVSPSATFDTLKKAYYKIVARYHPDKKDSEAEKDLCNRQMMVINAAFKALRDENQRRSYDLQRQQGIYGAKANLKLTVDDKNDSQRSYSPRPTHSDPPVTSSQSPPPSDQLDQELIEKINRKKQEILNSKPMSPTAARFKRLVEQSYGKDWEKSIEANAINEIKKESTTKNSKDNYVRSDSDHDEEVMYKLLYSRGDGSVISLKRILEQLKLKQIDILKLIKEDEKKDWGEVKDVKEVEKRLKNIENNRLIANRINELEREIQLYLGFTTDEHDSFDNNKPDHSKYNYYDRDRFHDDHDSNKRYQNYEPQPQPQRSKQPPNNPHKPWIETMDDRQPKPPKRKP